MKPVVLFAVYEYNVVFYSLMIKMPKFDRNHPQTQTEQVQRVSLHALGDVSVRCANFDVQVRDGQKEI